MSDTPLGADATDQPDLTPAIVASVASAGLFALAALALYILVPGRMTVVWVVLTLVILVAGLGAGLRSLNGIAGMVLAVATIAVNPGVGWLMAVGGLVFAGLVVGDVAATMRRSPVLDQRAVQGPLILGAAVLAGSVIITLATVSLTDSRVWNAGFIPAAVAALGLLLIAAAVIGGRGTPARSGARGRVPPPPVSR